MVYIHVDPIPDAHFSLEASWERLTLIQQVAQCLDTALNATTEQA